MILFAQNVNQVLFPDRLRLAEHERAELHLGEIRRIRIGIKYLAEDRRSDRLEKIVEIFPGTDGLLHISEIAEHRVRDVRDELKEGQQILVKCIGKEGNKIKLSRKAVLRDEKRNDQPKAEAAGQGDGE